MSSRTSRITPATARLAPSWFGSCQFFGHSSSFVFSCPSSRDVLLSRPGGLTLIVVLSEVHKLKTRRFSGLISSTVLLAHQDGLPVMNVEGHRGRFALARLVLGHNIAKCFKNVLTRIISNVICLHRQGVVWDFERDGLISTGDCINGSERSVESLFPFPILFFLRAGVNYVPRPVSRV